MSVVNIFCRRLERPVFKSWHSIKSDLWAWIKNCTLWCSVLVGNSFENVQQNWIDSRWKFWHSRLDKLLNFPGISLLEEISPNITQLLNFIVFSQTNCSVWREWHVKKPTIFHSENERLMNLNFTVNFDLTQTISLDSDFKWKIFDEWPDC